MVKCAVLSCHNDSRKINKKNSDITFHRFPKCMEMAKKWAIEILRPDWGPNIQSRICSKHFDSSSISESKCGLRMVVKGAVPKLHIKDEPSIKLVKLECFDGCVKVTEDEESERKIKVVTEDAPSKKLSKKVSDYDDKPGPKDTKQTLKLKRQILQLKELAKRRRLRCNALYAQRNRLKKKISFLSHMVIQLRKEKLGTLKYDIVITDSFSSDDEITVT